MNTKDPGGRNFSTISPSAKALLFMKGHTSIPFAREAAALMMEPEKFVPDFNKKDFKFWTRVAHFENRYLSVNQLLSGLPIQNILELSSGYSFRGLEAVTNDAVYYIDTDLPEVIEKKKQLISSLQNGSSNVKGKLELLPLNALDESSFINIVNRFPPGEIVIVNEGLLVYLNEEEKQKLCSIIHKVLEQRGGYWITADIYIKQKNSSRALAMDDKLQQFFDQHKIEENKFDSIEEAEAFFKRAGFTIDKEAVPDYSNVSALPYMLGSATQEQLAAMGKAGKIHNTWRLKIANK